MALSVGDIIQTTFEYDAYLQKEMNVFHWRVINGGSGPASEQVQEIADYFSDTVTAGAPAKGLKSIISESITMMRVRAQNIYPVRTAYRFTDIFEAGLLGLTKYSNVDAVITRRGLIAARGETGNTYIPGLPEEKVDNGLISGAHQLAISVAMQWVVQVHTMPVSGVELQPVIFHRQIGQASEVLDYLVQPEARVMTRRTVGRGQ